MHRTRLRALPGVATLLIVLVGLPGGLGLTVGAANSAFGATSTISISTFPALTPLFRSTILNYAVRCANHPTTSVHIRGSGPVVVGGKSFVAPVSRKVPLVAGQALQVTANGRSYYLRCLPSDFPSYTSQVTGHPQAE